MTSLSKRAFVLTMIAIAALVTCGLAMAQTSAPATTPAATTTLSVPDGGGRPEEREIATTAPASKPAPVANAVGEIVQTIGSLDPKSGYLFAVEVSNRGAAIETVRLSKYRQTVEDDQLYKKVGEDQKRYEEACSKNPGKYHGNYQLMGPVFEGGVLSLPMATKDVWFQVEGEPVVLPFHEKENLWKPVPYKRAAGEEDAQGVSFQAVGTVHGQPQLRITKTYAVKKGSYSVIMRLETENLTDKPARIMIDQSGPTGLPKEDYSKDDRNVLFGVIDPKDARKVGLGTKANAEIQDAKNPFPAGDRFIGSSDYGAARLVWLAADNKFFASSMYLMPNDPGDLAWDGAGARFYYGATDDRGPVGKTFYTGMKIGVGWTNSGQEIPGVVLEPHKPATFAFDIFSGPKKRDIFVDPDAAGSSPLYQKLSYVHLLSTQGSSCSFCVFDWLTLGMMWLLQKLSILALGNWGVAIMLLVCIVRLALHPLTKRGQVSMSKMSKFGPALKELQNKYADDKETLQKETMKFYKEHGATPILGCLPMFLQMPIWIALWTGLSATVELRHAAFLPFWLTNMAAPDSLFTWDTPLPLIGIHSLNLLPLLLTVAMFLQTKLNPSGMGATVATPDQQKQQKMMMYMMPIMMLFIFYNMPSGLNLYVMTSTFAGVIEQIVIKRHIARKQAESESLEIVVQGPGKADRDVRAKKPKGPGWHKQ